MKRIGISLAAASLMTGALTMGAAPAHAAAACGYYMRLNVEIPVNSTYTYEFDVTAQNTAKPSNCRVKIYTYYKRVGNSSQFLKKSSENKTSSFSTPSPGYKVYSYSAGAGGASNHFLMNKIGTKYQKLQHVKSIFYILKNGKQIKSCSLSTALYPAPRVWCGEN
ncbi:hypothetical protein [Nonomuraea sp. 10N515B]|uniref:hypothetical protein n=1 Tax=Nonomuraea sp. 10N515B TaxID=3457422 RepID=UPI003FCE082A